MDKIVEESLAEIKEIDFSSLSLRAKFIHLKKILERNCKEITRNESLQFPSFFARIVFISQKYSLPEPLEWQLQNIRAKSLFLRKDEKNIISQKQYDQAKETLTRFFSIISGKSADTYSWERYKKEISAIPLFFEKLRVLITGIDREKKIIFCKSDFLSNETFQVNYSSQIISDLFNDTIDLLWVGIQLNFIKAEINENEILTFKNIVFEPDYFIDASAISECFCNYGNSELHYFRRKFEAPANTHYILLGNLANFFLDELVNTHDLQNTRFEEVFIKSFKSMPFAYMACKDIQENTDFKNFMYKAKSQFENIKRVLLQDAPNNNFDLTRCILEPSFYSEKYGFQGRLDLLQPVSDKDDIYRIIELKSGKPPFPYDNPTKIAPNHEAQVTVYRLMIQGVFAKNSRSVCPTILYSSTEKNGENLRLAATYKTLENEILNIRNKIVATEHSLHTGNNETVEQIFFKLFDRNSYKRIPSFFENKLSDLQDVISSLSEVEKHYFYRFIVFISRELYLLKAGDESIDSSISISALWNTPFTERKEALELFDNLTIDDINSDGRDMKIRFIRNSTENCVNFREGELCILYPKDKEDDTILSNQILKGNIAEIKPDSILLRFRYKQKNWQFFEKYKYWVVEHDKLDHTYNQMFKNLYSFISAPKTARELLLGQRRPSSPTDFSDFSNRTLSPDTQREEIIEKALNAPNYFLIVGPPGTGKTSIFARRLIEEYYKQPNINILLIAYTNRAVDELCEAICNAFDESSEECDKYMRVGTELSCGKAYRPALLQNLAENVQNRKELAEIIQSRRIVVGTLAAIAGKSELFDVKKFHVAIIDEASQILEPQIIGLLPKFDKFILIGDHKQLSTITLQNEDKSEVENSLLNEIELYNCRESLFERIYRICSKNKWNDLFDTLIYHGRMHKVIADLINNSFYNGMLKTACKRQTEPLSYPFFNGENQYQKIIASNRTAFISVKKSDTTNPSNKMNQYEADIVTDMVRAIYELYKQNDLEFIPDKTIGIITPYRNQIALIKDKLQRANIADFNDIMIDTAERFQGSQRDIIIISMCINQPYQLRFFSNLDRENKVDRKLNVMLTRAREQLFLIGNDEILIQNHIYQDVINKMGIFDFANL